MTKKEKPRDSKKKGSWLTFRPDIKVMDCTIRDGGLMTNSHFEDKFVRAVYETCIAAGIDYMELGYKSDKKIYSQPEYGGWPCLFLNSKRAPVSLECTSGSG